ncbi:MAG: HSP20 family protein [Parcubacteria group bacterium Gr01-1014_20]|nr:MAG: HSP20 family protein [Parcubacteria group bacterium Gr01-1014_20]
MNEEHDTYFEELASEPANPEFELAKATSVAQPKLRIKKAAEEDEMEPEGQLTIDVYQTPSEIVIESAVAGVEPDDIDVNVTNDSITIKGRRRRAREVKDEDYFYQECYWGKFSRSVILPQEVDPEGSYVNFKNGILSVHLPKLNRKKARKLRVKLE